MYLHIFAVSITFMGIEQAIQQPKFTSEYHKLAVNIIYTASWLSLTHQHVLKPYNLTIQQFNVLRILRGQKGQPLSVNCLIERMVDRSSNASRIVDKLQEKQLVERAICSNDRRQVEVRITEKGLNLLSEIDEPMKNASKALEGLSMKEAETLNTLLDKMREAQGENTKSSFKNQIQ